MKAIGFANKFYTLWEITEETRPLGNGRSYLITNFTYIKNISMSREATIAKYPDVSIDENLRGKTRSWSSEKIIYDNVDTFRFGKYATMKIDNVFDTDYIAWYWDNVFEEHKDYVGEVLKAHGYEIREWGAGNKYLVSPEALENERKMNKAMNIMEAELKSGNFVHLFVERNLDYNGDYVENNITYHFPEVKENYYQGYEYYLPVVNGKQKRIKNKNLCITDYNYEVSDNEIKIEVLKFEIEK